MAGKKEPKPDAANREMNVIHHVPPAGCSAPLDELRRAMADILYQEFLAFEADRAESTK